MEFDMNVAAPKDEMVAASPHPATPAYPAFKEVRAPPAMDFGDRVLTVTTTYPNGHVYFNGTMLCNVGREYNTEKAGDAAEKKVSIWSNANTGLLEKVVTKIDDQPIRGKLVETNFPPIGQLSINDVIDTTNSKKKTGDPALRGTFVHIALFPALARYVSTDFAMHTDALLSRMFTGDYTVLADVIDICDSYNGATTSKMAIDMDEVRAARADTGEQMLGMLTSFFDSKFMPLLKEKNDTIKEKNLTIDLLNMAVRESKELVMQHKELDKQKTLMLQQATQINVALMEQFESDPNTLNKRVLPSSPDGCTLDGYPHLRVRLLNLGNSIVAALFKGSTVGPTTLYQQFVEGILNVQVLGHVVEDSVNTVMARSVLAGAIKLRAGASWGRKVKYCTEITARMAYTVVYNTEAWFAEKMPEISQTCSFYRTRVLFEKEFPGIKPLDIEEELELVPKPRTRRVRRTAVPKKFDRRAQCAEAEKQSM